MRNNNSVKRVNVFGAKDAYSNTFLYPAYWGTTCVLLTVHEFNINTITVGILASLQKTMDLLKQDGCINFGKNCSGIKGEHNGQKDKL